MFSKVWDYVMLGFAVFNAVTTLVVMIKNPLTLDAAAVWNVIRPVLTEITAATGVVIDMTIAQTLVTDAVNTLKAILLKK